MYEKISIGDIVVCAPFRYGDSDSHHALGSKLPDHHDVQKIALIVLNVDATCNLKNSYLNFTTVETDKFKRLNIFDWSVISVIRRQQ